MSYASGRMSLPAPANPAGATSLAKLLRLPVSTGAVWQADDSYLFSPWLELELPATMQGKCS